MRPRTLLRPGAGRGGCAGCRRRAAVCGRRLHLDTSGRACGGAPERLAGAISASTGSDHPGPSSTSSHARRSPESPAELRCDAGDPRAIGLETARARQVGPRRERRRRSDRRAAECRAREPRPGREGLVGDVRRLAVLDPADLGGRDPDRRSELSLRQPRLDSGLPQLFSDGQQCPSGQSPPSIEPALSGGHRSRMNPTASPPITTP
jgi:hypothetical protein